MIKFTTVLVCLFLTIVVSNVESKSNGYYLIATKLTPRSRPTVSPDFADSYWIPGTHFNSKNFKEMPSMASFSPLPKCLPFPGVMEETKNLMKLNGCSMLYKSDNCEGSPATVYFSDVAELELLDGVKSLKSCSSDN